MLCLWQPTFNHMRRSLDGFTSTIAPIRGAVRATASTVHRAHQGHLRSIVLALIGRLFTTF